MATTEQNGLLTYVDAAGNKNLLYPITRAKLVDGLEEMLDQLSSEIAGQMNKVYPIGSIYMSVNSTSPASLFGGTWEQLKDRFLLGAGDTYANGATGGAAEHTLTVEEIPSHRHGFQGDGTTFSGTVYSLNKSGTQYPSNPAITKGSDYTNNGYITAGFTGGGKSHNNMPPYLVVYMWKRTA